MGSLVLVHGAGGGAWCWDLVAPYLEMEGHTVTAVDLPLTGPQDDAEAVREVLRVADEPVVLVGHSYGGLVISRAATGDTVAHLVYIAGMLLGGSESYTRRLREFPAAPVAGHTVVEGDRFRVTRRGAVETYYNTCPPAVASDASRRLRWTARPCLREPAGAEPWRTIPTTYVLCEQDRAIHPAFQESMAARAGTVIRLDCDHSPFLSRPGDLADVLCEAAGAS